MLELLLNQILREGKPAIENFNDLLEAINDSSIFSGINACKSRVDVGKFCIFKFEYDKQEKSFIKYIISEFYQNGFNHTPYMVVRGALWGGRHIFAGRASNSLPIARAYDIIAHNKEIVTVYSRRGAFPSFGFFRKEKYWEKS